MVRDQPRLSSCCPRFMLLLPLLRLCVRVSHFVHRRRLYRLRLACRAYSRIEMIRLDGKLYISKAAMIR